VRVEWHGQAAFTLSGKEGTVVIDPFGDVSSFRKRGIQWNYPPIEAPAADLVLVTHEHRDHNGVEAVGGEPAVVRARAGRYESPLGEVIGIASEHDQAAGTERGPNTIFAFGLDGLRVVAMHYRTERIGFLEPEDEFVAAMGEPLRLQSTSFDTGELPQDGGPTVVIPAAP
jgi:Beta-lactamase superfamily domain